MMEELVYNSPHQDDSIIMPTDSSTGESNTSDAEGIAATNNDTTSPPRTNGNNGDKKTLARKLRGVGRKVIRLSILPKKALSLAKKGKNKDTDKDGDEVSTATTGLESFTIEIDSDTNQVKVLQTSALSSGLMEPTLQEDYSSPSLELKEGGDMSLQSLEQYVLQEVVHSMDTMMTNSDNCDNFDENKEEEEQEQEEDQFAVEIEVKGPDGKKEQDTTPAVAGETEKPQSTLVETSNNNNNNNNNIMELTDMDDLNDAIVLAVGRHHHAASNKQYRQQNGKVHMDGIKDFVSHLQAAPFLMKFTTCGALECPPCDANGDPHNNNSRTLSQEKLSPIKSVGSRTHSEPDPLSWLGSPVDGEGDDDDDDDNDVNGDDAEEEVLAPVVDENAKEEGQDGRVDALVSPSSLPEVAPSKSLQSFQEEEAATVQSVVSLEKKREDMARMQWHKQFLHESVQRMLDEKAKQTTVNVGIDVLETGEEKKEDIRDIIMTHTLSPPPELMRKGAIVHGNDEEDEGKEEKQADAVASNDHRFHDDFDEFHFEANFPNIEVESVQFEEENTVEITEELQKPFSPHRLQEEQKTPQRTHDVERLLNPIDGKAAAVEGQREDRHLDETDACLLGEEIMESTLAGDVSIGYIVRDLDKLQGVAAARSNPPQPPPTPPSAVSKSRSYGFPPLHPSPTPSPARSEKGQLPQSQDSVVKERNPEESKEDNQVPPQSKLMSEFASLVKKHSSSFSEHVAKEDNNPTALDQAGAAYEEKEQNANDASLLAEIDKPRIPPYSMFDEDTVVSEEEEEKTGDDEAVEPSKEPNTGGVDVQKSNNAKRGENAPKFTEDDTIFDGTDDIPLATIALQKKPPIQPDYTYDLVDKSRDSKRRDELPCNEIIVDRSFSSRINSGTAIGKKRVAFDLSDDLKSTASMTTARSAASFNNENIFYYGCVGGAGADVTKAIIKGIDRYIDSMDDETMNDEESEYSLML